MITSLVADYRADIMVAREVDDATPLIVAAKHQQYDAVCALLRALHLLPPRLAVEYLAAEDKSDSTARAWAVLKGNRRIVDAIDTAERETLQRKVTCRNRCGRGIPLGQLEKHQSYYCPVVTRICPNGCGLRVRHEMMTLHEGKECPKRIRVSPTKRDGAPGHMRGNVSPQKRNAPSDFYGLKDDAYTRFFGLSDVDPSRGR